MILYVISVRFGIFKAQNDSLSAFLQQIKTNSFSLIFVYIKDAQPIFFQDRFFSFWLVGWVV